MRTDRASHGNAVVNAAKQRFWNAGITASVRNRPCNRSPRRRMRPPFPPRTT